MECRCTTALGDVENTALSAPLCSTKSDIRGIEVAPVLAVVVCDMLVYARCNAIDGIYTKRDGIARRVAALKCVVACRVFKAERR